MPETTAVATVNMAMLDRAEADSGTSSVMDQIHTLKIYNPAPGEPAEADKAGKFKLVQANTREEVYLEGDIKFNVLGIAYNYTGKIYPVLPNGEIADEEVFFTTSEFGKFDKKVDPIGLATKGKGYAFFAKGEFEAMIKAPTLNGMTNQFYDKKKDKDGKPYHSTLLRKSGIVYGQFIGGAYDHEYFRFFTSPNNLGVTYDREMGEIDPDEGTLEYVTIPALTEMNAIRAQNDKKAITRVHHDQCDVVLSIRENEKHNFLPVFTFAGLTAMRGYDNSDDIQFIKDIRQEHFRSIFGQMGAMTSIALEGTNAKAILPEMHVEAHAAIAAPNGISIADANEAFDDPKADF